MRLFGQHRKAAERGSTDREQRQKESISTHGSNILTVPFHKRNSLLDLLVRISPAAFFRKRCWKALLDSRPFNLPYLPLLITGGRGRLSVFNVHFESAVLKQETKEQHAQS